MHQSMLFFSLPLLLPFQNPGCGDFEILRFFSPVCGAPVRREAKTFQNLWKAEHTLKTNQGFVLEDFKIENVPYIFVNIKATSVD